MSAATVSISLSQIDYEFVEGVQEHQCITKLAEAKHKKHSGYGPINEHDGVLFHRGDNQVGSVALLYVCNMKCMLRETSTALSLRVNAATKEVSKQT
ncbi:hypothetical protein Tco_1229899, partial [Tanacetum coccineum]